MTNDINSLQKINVPFIFIGKKLGGDSKGSGTQPHELTSGGGWSDLKKMGNLFHRFVRAIDVLAGKDFEVKG